MAANNGTTPWKLVKVPAILTLVVTLVRLIGELLELDPALFSREAGGGAAVVGISWLIFVFGFYFGWRLARAGRAPRVPGRVLITYVVLLAISFVAFLVIVGLPEEGQPLEPTPFLIFNGVLWVCALVTLFSWPALARALFLYGLLARIPVVLVTLLSVAFGWQTHYVALPPEAPEVEGLELAMFASVPQIGLWVPATVLLGGLFGGLGALAGKRGRG